MAEDTPKLRAVPIYVDKNEFAKLADDLLQSGDFIGHSSLGFMYCCPECGHWADNDDSDGHAVGCSRDKRPSN